jgi:hypothetical protein
MYSRFDGVVSAMILFTFYAESFNRDPKLFIGNGENLKFATYHSMLLGTQTVLPSRMTRNGVKC